LSIADHPAPASSDADKLLGISVYTCIFLSSVLFFCSCVTNEFAAKVRSKKIEKKSRPKSTHTRLYLCVCGAALKVVSLLSGVLG